MRVTLYVRSNRDLSLVWGLRFADQKSLAYGAAFGLAHHVNLSGELVPFEMRSGIERVERPAFNSQDH